MLTADCISAGSPSALSLQPCTCRSEKALDEICDLIGSGVQGKMPSINDMHFGFRYVPAIGLRLRWVERELVLSPNHQQSRLLLAHPSLPLRIVLHVGAIVVKQIALNLSLAGLIEEIKLVGPKIGVVTGHIRIVSDMASLRGFKRQQVLTQGCFMSRPVCPE